VNVALALSLAAPAMAHNVEARYIEELPWQRPHFAHIYAMGYAELGRDLDVSHAEIKDIGGQACIVGSMVAFEVDKSYAYDIDEPVELTVRYAPAFTTTPILVLWNKNGGLGRGEKRISVEPGAAIREFTVTLDRARFAKFGTRGVDLAIQTTDDKDQGLPDGHIAICDAQIARHPVQNAPPEFGSVQISVHDAETGASIPARIGIYDATGRAPLPSDQALLVERFADKVRLLTVDRRAFWPTDNRVAFYVGGPYAANLPAGRYEIAVTHGPEFRAYHGWFELRAGQEKELSVKLPRYADLPSRGWYSGDDHIHLAREAVGDRNVWTQVAAEDVHVGNLLQMGNIAGTWFEQPAWGKPGRFAQGGYLVASGQEDPRTGHLGHTIHENLQRPIHLGPDSYFLYSQVFHESHQQGGTSGYAHLNAGWFNARRGCALDIPFGDVDFLEVFQAGRLSTDPWYDFLNLGFQITPSAGSDFPYTDLPGVVRLYVKVDHPDDPDAWYASFHAGHAYVTNGPFLEFTVNGSPMGSVLHVARGAMLKVAAQATLNPDVDTLDRLELVILGDVVLRASAHGGHEVRLSTQFVASHSQWIAVRAYGGRHEEWNMTAAHSAPVYVIVDREPSWKRQQVAKLVARERAMLEEILTAPLIPTEDLEAFVTTKSLAEQWPRQRRLLEPRVKQAETLYDDLLRRAQQWADPVPGAAH
jgi:hypothetical protein